MQNKKVIRSRNVIFNEEVMYKNIQAAESESLVRKDRQFVSLEDLTNEDVSNENQGTEQQEAAPEVTQPENVPIVEPEVPPFVPRVSTRSTKGIPAKKFLPSANYLLLTDCGEPVSYDEAMQHADSIKWEGAMEDEMDSLMSNNTWELAKLPKDKKALHNKWIYKIKQEVDGSKRYKARLVMKGFQQKEGIYFDEIFSPVVKHTTIRVVLGLVEAEGLYLEQLDVKTAFLHGDLKEVIYMEQPQGYIAPGKEDLVCKLQKSLYGLKQAPRQWYKKFDAFMCGSGYTRCQSDHCCYFKRFDNSYIILLLYVDDMLIAGANFNEIEKLKKEMSNQFAMKDLGAAKKILGIKIIRDKVVGTLKLSQAEYVEKVIRQFNMYDAKPVGTPLAAHFQLSKEQSPKSEKEEEYMKKVPYASAVGCLMYIMVCTRPDIAQVVGAVSRYTSNPGKQHWEAVKWIMRHLRGTIDMSLCFKRGSTELQGYVDADLTGDRDTYRSTTGYVYTVGGAAVVWVSNLQGQVALSTTESEYVAIAEAGKEMVWLKGLLEELGKEQENCVLHSDSQSAIHLAKNPALHLRTKHIPMRYHYIRELVENEVLKLMKIPGSENPADMLTKSVPIGKLKLCLASVGLQA